MAESSSENNFRDFFKNNADFLFILDMDANIIETNNAVHDILGYSEDDLIGKNVLLVHPPEFREEAAEVVRQMLAGEKSFCPIPLLTKDNEYMPVETRVFPGIWNSKQALIGVSRNMSEIKLSEEKFFNVFNHCHTLMAISTFDTGIFIDVNQEFLKTLGYTREEIIGTASKDLNLFQDYSQREKALNIFQEDGQLENFEAIIRTKSGDPLNCLFSLVRFKIQTFEYMLTTATNITSLKKAESKIQYFFKQQKLLADISQLLNSTTNLELILGDVLRLIGEHLNVSRVYIFEEINESIARNSYNWSNPGVKLQINGQEISYDLIPSWKEMLIKDGRIFSSHIQDLPNDMYKQLLIQGIRSILVYPLYVQDIFYGFIGFHECVSNKVWAEDEIDLLKTVSNIISNAIERKLVLKKLKDSELRLQLAIDSANEGIWDWNNTTGHVFYNDNWCRMLGYTPNEIAPNISSWEKLIHPDDLPRLKETLENHLDLKTEYYEAVCRLKTKDGNWKWILDHGMVIERNEHNKPLRTVGTHIDITRQKETELKLQESIDTKNKLFSIIAHDLRGPIGNFIPILDMISGDNELDKSTKKSLLDDMKKSTQTTYELLVNLLNWSRCQDNSISLMPSQFVLNKIISNNVELLTPTANQKSITIQVKTNKILSAFADSDSISLVVRNLLSNALKFTPNNGTITISAFDNDRQIEVEIEDNGIGMQKEVTDSLFKVKSFHSTPGTNFEKGSGLGLVLCKEFTERNGGQIRVESTLGKGSKFTFTLPKAHT